MAVKGLRQVLRNIKQLEQQIQDEIRLDVEDFTEQILREAIRNAPGAGDQLKTTYGTQKNDTNIQQFIDSQLLNGGFTGRVFIQAAASNLAVYIEFGTGSSAAGYVPTLPAEWQEVARKYYINGKGTLIKQPFLLPAYFSNEIKFLKAVQNTLKKYGLKTVYIP